MGAAQASRELETAGNSRESVVIVVIVVVVVGRTMSFRSMEASIASTTLPQ
jgi:hypothetical protein